MPLTKLQFKPGINRDITSYSNESGWVDCDKVRFRQGFPEVIGGWEKYSSETYIGTVRGLINWTGLDGSDFLGLGTESKYYIEQGQQFYDVTPIRATTTNGITFARVRKGVVLFSANVKTVGDSLKGGADLINQISDGTNTCVTLRTVFKEPVLLDPVFEDKISIVINDDMTGLISFTAMAIGRTELIT